MKYKENIKLRLDDKNGKGTVKEAAILRIFEQIAESQAQEMNIDGGTFIKEGKAWIINRIVLEMFKSYPNLMAVDAITYPRSSNGIEFARDFAVTKTGGGLIARGTSSWSVIDVAQRRLVACKDLPNYKEFCEDTEMLDKNYRKVRIDNSCFGKEYLRLSVKTMRSDEDSLGHLHNVRYIEFCINALTEEEYAKGIDSLNITFIKETLIGDVIDIYAKYTDDKTLFMQGKVVGEEKEYFCFATVITFKN